METCTYLPDGVEDDGVTTNEGTFEGTCASMALVERGVLVERGCDSKKKKKSVDKDGKKEKKNNGEEGDRNESSEEQSTMVDDEDDDGEDGGMTMTTTYTGDSGNDDDNIHHIPSSSPPSSSTTATTTAPAENAVATEEPGNDNNDSSDLQQNGGTSTTQPNDHPTNISSSSSPSSSSPSSSSSEACIAADMLSHLPTHALIFSSHLRAAVLCDPFGSCATPGHFVVHGGRAMTMRQYCASAVEGKCTRRVKLVNSPRMRARSASTAEGGVRVGSQSPGLTFTALAARFDTRVERWALRLVVEQLGF